MRYLLILILLSATSVSKACYCLPDSRSVNEKVKQYPFIALVKIIGYEKSNETATGLHGETVRLKFQLLEVFKGEKDVTVYEASINTSCDNGIRFGGEWLLFASASSDNKFVFTNPCGLSLQLRNASGERTGYDAGNQMMDSLRYVLSLPAVKKKNGRISEYFDNGKLAVSEKFRSGVLTGERRIYYNNGKLAKSEHYKHGKYEGLQRHYARSGQLLWEYSVRDGEPIRSTMWYDTSFNERKMTYLVGQIFLTRTALDSFTLANPMKIQIRNLYHFNPKTEESNSRQFDWKGNLERTIQSDRKSGVTIYTEYFESGSIKSVDTSDKGNNTEERKEWDESGKLISRKLWKNGKLTEQKKFE